MVSITINNFLPESLDICVIEFKWRVIVRILTIAILNYH